MRMINQALLIIVTFPILPACNQVLPATNPPIIIKPIICKLHPGTPPALPPAFPDIVEFNIEFGSLYDERRVVFYSNFDAVHVTKVFDKYLVTAPNGVAATEKIVPGKNKNIIITLIIDNITYQSEFDPKNGTWIQINYHDGEVIILQSPVFFVHT